MWRSITKNYMQQGAHSAGCAENRRYFLPRHPERALKDDKLDVAAWELSIIIGRTPQAFLASRNSNMLFESVVRKRPEFEDMGMWEAIQQLMERERQKDFDSLLPELRTDGISRKRYAKEELNMTQPLLNELGNLS